MPIGLTRRQKPPIGTPLDRHPLLNGCLWFAPGWEGSGGTAVDLIGGNNLFLGSTTSWQPGVSPLSGGGIGCLAAGTGAVSGPWTTSYRPTAGPWTLVAGLSWTGTAHSSFGEIFGLSANNSNAANSYPLKIQWSGSSNFFRAVSSTSMLAAGSAAITANTLIVLVVTANSSGSVMYINGLVAGTGGALVSGPSWTTASGVWCGSLDPGGVGSGLAAQIRCHFGAVYGRVLSAGEALAWANPWQVFAPAVPMSWLTSGAIGPSYLPWIFGDQCCENGC